MIYKMELSDSVDTMVFELLEVPIEGKDITGIADNTTIDGNVFRDYLWLKKQWTQRWSIMCQDEYERLRGFWTRQFGNAEVPLYRLFYGENRYEDRNAFTVNGFVQIEDDAPLYSPLSLTNLYGNATQETTTGKNMFCIATSGDKRIGGLNFTIDDGVIHINGTTAGTSYYYFDTFHVPNSGSAILSMSVIGTIANWTNAFGVRVSDDGETWSNVVNIAPPTLSGTLTLDSSKYYQCFWYVNASGVVYNNVGFKVQLEYGSTATDWEEYTAGASPNPSYPQAVNVVSGAQTVRITGKNLVEDTISGSSIDGNGIIRSNSDFDTQVAFVMEGETYTLSYTGRTVVGGYFATKPTMNSMSIDGTRIVNHNKTFVAQYTGYFTFRTDAGVSNAQCELGSQATAYEPYQSQSQEINLGKNLCGGYSSSFNRTSAYVAFENNADGTIKASGTATGAGAYSINQSQATQYGWVKNLQAGTYSFSLKDAVPSGTTVRVMNHATDAVIATAPQTFTLNDKTDVFISVKVNVGDSIDMTIKPQLERGSQATSYAPYKTPIELAKIGTYQDYIWNDGGTWRVHKEVGKAQYDTGISGIGEGQSGATVASTEGSFFIQNTAWNYAGGDYDNDVALARMSENIGQYVEQNLPANGQARSMQDGTFCQRTGTNDRIYFRCSSLAGKTGNEVKALLQPQGGAQFYYALATPTDTEITDSELIEQLNHIYSLYGGQNNLWLIPSGGAQGEIGVKYRLNYEEETDIIPSTPVVLTLSDGGVINTCGCRQNIQLIMRETESD